MTRRIFPRSRYETPVASVFASAPSCWLGIRSCLPERHVWHQKLTLVIDTPQGEVSGSSVVEVRVGFYEGGQFMSGTEVEYDVTGEAVVVEVLPGRYLFALLGNSEELFFYAATDRFEGLTRGEWLRLIPDQTDPVTLTGDLIPMLVTFADIEDPKTVELVDPADLAASFGPGVVLKTVVLEVTDEPLTDGRVERLLGWWLSMRSGPTDGMVSLRLPNQSPRGWDNLTVLQFWSLDRVLSFKEREN